MNRCDPKHVKKELADVDNELSRLLADGFKITRFKIEQEAGDGFDGEITGEITIGFVKKPKESGGDE